jgi:asparagine synthase (glutamine-hydrolysing)
MHPSLRPFPLFINKFVPDFLRQPLRKLMRRSATKPDWLDANLLNAKDRDPYQMGRHKSVVDQSMRQLSSTSLPMLLHYEDRDSMAHSVESRTPFLDFRLVEFSLGLSSDYKISNGWTKRVLRESMKGVLPETVRQRVDKMGFLTAEEEWLRRQGTERFRQELMGAVDSCQGILKSSAVGHFQEMVDGKRPFSYLPWRQIVFGYWMRRFNVSIC